MSVTSSLLDHVYRCAWCAKAEPVAGGLLYFVYTRDDGPGRRQVAPADAARWSHSDGICPAHLAAIR